LGDQAAQNTLGDRESLDFEGFKEVVAHLAKMQMEGSANGESSNRFEAIQRKKAETHVNKMKEEKFLPMDSLSALKKSKDGVSDSDSIRKASPPS
jgi:hypothetical protein